jgi:hypothetical protein
MDLTEAQKEAVRSWVQEDCGLSQIQKRLSEEFGISMTYMDVRFLIIDLGLEIKDKASSRPETTDISSPPPGPVGTMGTDAGASPTAGAGSVSVELDRITKPGAIVSGTVTFSDGKSTTWALDQFGRLGLAPPEPGYSPTPQDLQAFQQALRQEMAKRGF